MWKMKKSKIISRLISNRPFTRKEFWDSLPDVVHSKDVKTGYYDLFKKLNPNLHKEKDDE